MPLAVRELSKHIDTARAARLIQKIYDGCQNPRGLGYFPAR